MKSKKDIPNFSLTDRAKKGILITELRDHTRYQGHVVSKPHRDDHFAILVIASGTFEMNVDFENVQLKAPSFLLITPEQIHYIGKAKNAQGWLMNVEPSIILPEIADILGDHLARPVNLGKKNTITDQLYSLLATATSVSHENNNAFSDKTILLIVNAILSLLLSSVMPDNQTSIKKSRGALISKQFKILLEAQFKTMKKASQYASELSITPTHLNDTIKESTGLTVTAHIQQRSILEAKRLLFFTDHPVSEVGYETGYEDPVYFGKLFKKLTGLTPLAFRSKFRE